MAEKLGKAILEITIDDKDYRLQLDQARKGAKGLEEDVKGIGRGVNLLVFKELGEVAVKAIGAIIGKIAELGQRGATVADVRGSFEGLAAGVKSTADVMLGALRQGVQGTVSDFELMQVANKGLGAGLKLSATDMGTLAAGAKMLADRTGKDTKDAFDALTTAMITGRTKGLAEFAFATKNGTTLIGDLGSQLAQAGPATLDFTDRVDQAKAGLANFTDQLALGIAQSPVLQAGMEATGRAFTAAFGPQAGGLVGATVKAVEGLAIGLTYVGQAGVIAAQVILAGFNGAKTVIGGVMSVVAALGQILIGSVGEIAALLQNIPGHAKWIDTFAQSTATATAYMKGLTAGLAEETAAAARATIGQGETNATLDRMAGALVTVRDAMNATSATTIQTTQAETMAINAHAAAFQLANQSMFLSRQQLAQAMQTFAAQELLLQQTADAAMLALLQQSLAAQAAAQGAYQIQTMTMAEQAGFKTREELEATAAKALETYQRMLESGLYTAAELQAAFEAAEAAKREASGETAEFQKLTFQDVADAASGILRSLFGKSKAAAIAAVAIDAAAAIVKCFAQFGFWGFIPAAAVAAATAKQIQQIKNQEASGFAQGTPDLDFMNFGPESFRALHGDEAVIPRGSGHLLAQEIAEAMPRAMRDTAERSGATPTADVRGQGEAAIILDGEVVGRWFMRRNRSGLLPVVVR